MDVGLRAGQGSGKGGGLLRLPRKILEKIGRTSAAVTEHAGQMGILFWKVVVGLVQLRVSYREILTQIYVIGVQSVPIVIVTAILAGIVTSQQGGYQFTGTIPLYVMGSIVTTSVILELAPVLTGIVLVGRVGARITAELGTMEVSEQIDAFHSVGRDPITALAAPRIVAGVIALPLLTAVSIIVGLYSGMVSAQLTLGLGSEAFFFGARLFWHNWDLLYSLSKAATFGLAIPLISTHMGFRTSGGAAGVGKTTTQSVMFMTLTILILDALFPPIFLD